MENNGSSDRYEGSTYDSSLESVGPIDATGGSGVDSYVSAGTRSPFRFNRSALIATAVALGVLLVIAGATYVMSSRNRAAQQGVNENYSAGKISIDDIEPGQQLEFSDAEALAINGQLQINQGLVVAPTSPSNDPVIGEIYLDKVTKELYFYNGVAYVSLSNPQVVTSLGGASGVIGIGAGLTLAEGQLGLSGTSVTSVQGQTGDVSFSGGQGIGITGLTIANTGVTGLTGTANQVNVSSGTGVVTLSLPQGIAPTSNVTFAGITTSTLSGIQVLSPSAGVNYSFGAAPAGDYEICTTFSGCGAVGSVDATGSSAGSIALFLDSNTLTNSALSQVGLDIAAAANLAVAGILSGNGSGLTNVNAAQLNGQLASFYRNASNINAGLLGVTFGGTGANTAAGARANLSAAASGANADITSLSSLTSITPSSALTIGASGQNLTLQGNASTSLSAVSGSFTSNLVFANPAANSTITIPNATGTICLGLPVNNCGFAAGGSGVSMLNGLAGALTLANASGVGSTITINDASSGAKGIASFNAGDFMVAAGAVSLNTVAINRGGTGLTATPTNGQLLIGNGSGYSLATLTGDATIDIVNGPGTITLSVPRADECSTCADRTLNNLTTTSINAHLLAQTGIDLGSTSNPFRELYVYGTSGTPSSQNFKFTGIATSSRTITIPDASGSICLDTGNCAGAGGGVTVSSPGTNGTVALFTGTQSIANSVITQSGGNITVAGNLAASAITGTTINGLTLTSGTDPTISNGTKTLTLQASASLNQNLLTSSNVTFSAIQSNGGITVANGQALTVNTLTPSAGNALSIGATGASQTTNLQGNSITFTNGSRTYSFASTAAGSQTICDTSGNCAGAGGGITGSGTTNTVPLFTSGNTIGNSIITQPTGTSVQVAGTLSVTGSTISGTGALTVASTGGANPLTLSSGSGIVSLGGSTTTIQRSGTAMTLDILSAANSTLTVTNSNGGVANLAVEGGVNIGSGQEYGINGVSINTAGTLSNVAYLDQANQFTGIVNDFTGHISVGGEINGQIINYDSIIGGTLEIQGENALVLGDSGTYSGAIIFRNSIGSNTITLLAPSVDPAASFDIFLPDSLPVGTECLNIDAGGQIGTQGCASGLGGGGSTNRIAKFDVGGAAIIDSSIIDDGTNITIQGTGTTFTAQGRIVVGVNGASGNPGYIDFLSGGNPGVAVSVRAQDAGSTYELQLPTTADVGSSCLILSNVSPGVNKITGGACAAGGSGGNVTASGTTSGRLLRATNDGPAYSVAASTIYDDGTNVGIGTTQNASYVLRVGSSNAFNVTNSGQLEIGAGTPLTLATNGNISNVGTLTASGLLQTSAGGQGLALSGAPTNTANQSLVRLGNAINTSGGNGNTAVNGGTYLGINAPSSGAGSAADFLNFQSNGTARLRVDSGGNLITAGTYNGLTLGQGANQFSITGGTGTARTLTVTGNSVINQDLATTSSVQFNSLTLTNKLAIAQGGTGSDTTGASAGAALLYNATLGRFQANVITSSDSSINVTPGDGTLNLTVASCTTCANNTLSNLGVTNINAHLLAQTGVDLGSSANPFRDLYVYGTSGTPASQNFRFTGAATTTRTITIPDDTGTLCLSTGNCASVGGGVTVSSNGTNGTIAMFTGAQTIANSLLSQSGALVTVAGDLTASAITGTTVNGLTLTSGTDPTISNGTKTLTLQASVSLNQNLLTTSSVTFGAIQANGGITVANGQTVTANTITPSAGNALTLGATGASQTTSLQGTSISFINGSRTYNFASTAAGTQTICDTSGNCAGVGGGITGSGTNNTIPVFTGGNTIGNSIITQPTGSSIAIAGTLSTGANTINGATISGGTLSGGSVSGGTLTATAVNSLNVGANAISTGSGNLTVDANGAGTISLGATSTGDILIGGGFGSTGCTLTNSNGNLNCNGTINGATLSGGTISGGTLTGTTVNGLAVSGTAITASGALTVDANGANTISLGGTSTGDILLGGGVGSTGCTLTNSTGALACTSTINGATISGGTISGGNIQGGTLTASAVNGLNVSGTAVAVATAATSLSIDAGTTGDINIGSTSTGNILLAGGAASTGCTITNSTGAIDCSGTFTVGSLGTADTATALCRNSSNQLATCTGGGSTLQGAYDGGNTIQTPTSGAARDVSITLRDSSGTDSSFITNVATGATGKFAIQYNGSDTFSLTNASGAQGSATFKNATNNTSAFQIQNAASATLFNVDTTNNIIAGRINPSTSVATRQALAATDPDGDAAGIYSSIAVGTDGLPIVVYENASNSDLKIMKCSDVACGSGGRIFTEVASTDNTGREPSIAIGTDGLPIIAYRNATSLNLEIIKCTNQSCSTRSGPYVVSTANDDGYESQIAISRDGMPIISYYNSTDGDINVLKCTVADCASGNTPTELTNAQVHGRNGSIAIGTDGLPILTYNDVTDSALNITKCTNAACTASNAPVQIDNGANGQQSEVVIGSDGLPFIVALDATSATHALQLVKCTNQACSTFINSSFSGASSIGDWPSVAIGTNGLPIVGHRNVTSDQLNVYNCNNLACTSGTNYGAAGGGQYSDTVIGSDGLPIFAHYNTAPTPDVLGILTCDDIYCSNTSTASNAVTGGIVLGTINAPFKSLFFNTLNLGMQGARVVLNAEGNFYANALFASNDGKVGVGNLQPTYKLDIDGDVNVSSGSVYRVNGVAGLTASCSSGQVLATAVLSGGITTSGTCSTVASSANAFLNNGNSFAGLATLGTNDANALALETSGIERVRILSTGQVGIGTTTPTSFLQVEGPAGAAGIAGGHGGNAIEGLRVVGGAGGYGGPGPTTNQGGNGGIGSTLHLQAGGGGNGGHDGSDANGGDGGAGGGIVLQTGSGGVGADRAAGIGTRSGGDGANGGNMTITLGNGGNGGFGDNGSLNGSAGDGGSFTLQAGTGGVAGGLNNAGALRNGVGGSISLLAGTGGANSSAGGGNGGDITLQAGSKAGSGTPRDGYVLLNSSGVGLVGIGTATPTARLSIGTNSDTTAANGISFGTDTTLYRSGASTLTTDSNFLVKTATNSSAAAVIQNAGGANLFAADTANMSITINGALATTGQLGSWTTTSSLPQGRVSGATATYNSYVYVIAGQNTSGVSQTTVYYARLNADGTIPASGSGAWATTTAFGGTARTSASAVVVNGYLYVMGGYDGAVHASDTWYAKINSDGTVGTWTSTDSMNHAHTGGVAVAVNGYIYMMSGNDGFGVKNFVEYAKPNLDGSIPTSGTGTWTDTNGALTRESAAAVAANGYIYMLGGSFDGSNDGQATVASAKINSDGSLTTWTTTNGMTTVRRGPSAVVANGYIYAYGGVHTGVGYRSSVEYAKLNTDGTTGTWTTQNTTNPMTQARAWAGRGIVVNGYVYAIGGSNGTQLATVDFASVNRLKVGAALDLVGLAGASLTEDGVEEGISSVGGELTAGNTRVIGLLNVVGGATFMQGVYMAKDLSVAGSINLNGTSGSTINSVGGVTFKNFTNSTTALQIQNASGVSMLTADTTNNVLRQALPNTYVSLSRTTTTTGLGDTADSFGTDSDMVMGLDGLPIIVTYNGTDTALRIIKCGNIDCSSGNTVTDVDEGAADVGRRPGIAIPADGNPIITYGYLNAGDYQLRIMKCSNPSCSSNSVQSFNEADNIADFTDVVIGKDGLPIVAYDNVTDGDVVTRHCTNASCSTSDTPVQSNGPGSNTIGQYVNIVVTSDGLPVLAFRNNNNLDVNFLKCGSSTCTTHGAIQQYTSGDNEGADISMVVGSDGLPVLVFTDSTNTDPEIIKCNAVDCNSTSYYSGARVGVADVGVAGSIAVGPDGNPIMTFWIDRSGTTSDNLAIIACNDLNCGTLSWESGEHSTAASDGYDPAMMIGPSGFPIVVYLNIAVNDIHYLKCSDRACNTATGTAFTGGTTIGTSETPYRSIYVDTINFARPNARVVLDDKGNFYSNSLYAANNGNVGIGMTNPSARLDVFLGTQTSATNIFQVRSDIGSKYDVKFRVQANGQVFADGAYSGAGADVAEMYQSTENLVAGDVVVFDGSTILRSSQTGQTNLAGVISTDPGLILGNGDNTPANSFPLALSGRAPVNVTDEGGAILPGDYLTSSSTPGKAMKATGNQPIIGRALEGLSGTSGTILMFVENHRKAADTLQAASATINDLQATNITTDNINVTGNATLADLTVTGDAAVEGKLTVDSIEVGDLTINGHIITASGEPTTEVQLAAGAGAVVNISGNDTAGTITITTGSTPTAGELAKLIFSKVYGKAPRVVLSPSNDPASGLRFYKGATTLSDFMFNAKDTPAANTTYIYDYFVVE